MNPLSRTCLLRPTLVAFVATLAHLSCSAPDEPRSVVRGRLLMSTLFEITVVGTRSDPLDVSLDSAFAEIERIERLTSDFDSTSAVALLNSRRGQPQRVPNELLGLFRRAVGFAEITTGAFDVTTGTATALWRSAERAGTPPSDAALDEAARWIGPRHVALDEAAQTITLDSGTLADLGAIAKGYAVDRALALLRRTGATAALVNGGGDIAAFGEPLRALTTEDEATSGDTLESEVVGPTPWLIGIRHPRRGPEEYFGIVYLEGGAVASSGDYERGYVIGDPAHGGRVYGHILDPHTARPARRCVSTTVTAPSAETADALATAAFVLGPDSGRTMLERIRGVEGLIVVEGDRKLVSYVTSGFLDVAGIDTTQVTVVVSPPVSVGGKR